MLRSSATFNRLILLFFFFFNDTATTEIYTLSLHDALPISRQIASYGPARLVLLERAESALYFTHLEVAKANPGVEVVRSEEHTSELQSQSNLVCRLLLEKKKKQTCQVRTDTHTSECTRLHL